MSLKLYILSLILIITLSTISYGDSPKSPLSKNLNLLQTPVKKLTESAFNLNRKTEAPLPSFNKNSYDTQKNIVWREQRPNDGVTLWYHDESLGVYWRYLRPNENPITLTVPNIQSNQTISQINWGNECRT